MKHEATFYLELQRLKQVQICMSIMKMIRKIWFSGLTQKSNTWISESQSLIH